MPSESFSQYKKEKFIKVSSTLVRNSPLIKIICFHPLGAKSALWSWSVHVENARRKIAKILWKRCTISIIPRFGEQKK